MIFSQRHYQIDAAHFRHEQIRDDEVSRRRRKLRQGFTAVAGFKDCVTLLPQQDCEHFPQRIIVICQKDAGHACI